MSKSGPLIVRRLGRHDDRGNPTLPLTGNELKKSVRAKGRIGGSGGNAICRLLDALVAERRRNVRALPVERADDFVAGRRQRFDKPEAGERAGAGKKDLHRRGYLRWLAGSNPDGSGPCPKSPPVRMASGCPKCGIVVADAALMFGRIKFAWRDKMTRVGLRASGSVGGSRWVRKDGAVSAVSSTVKYFRNVGDSAANL